MIFGDIRKCRFERVRDDTARLLLGYIITQIGPSRFNTFNHYVHRDLVKSGEVRRLADTAGCADDVSRNSPFQLLETLGAE